MEVEEKSIQTRKDIDRRRSSGLSSNSIWSGSERVFFARSVPTSYYTVQENQQQHLKATWFGGVVDGAMPIIVQFQVLHASKNPYLPMYWNFKSVGSI